RRAFSLCFFLSCSAHHRRLHSFPTRRSSDLRAKASRTAPLIRPRSGTAYPWLRAHCRTSAVLEAVGPLLCECAGLANMTGTEGKDRKSTRLNSSHVKISYAVFCLKKKKKTT